jgi:hypothetical protein
MKNEKKKDGTQFLSQTVSQSERDRNRDGDRKVRHPSSFTPALETLLRQNPKKTNKQNNKRRVRVKNTSF